MRKLSKVELKMLKKLSDNIPVVVNNTHEVHLVKGKDLLQMFEESGEDILDGANVQAKDIDPEKTYRYCFPVQLYQNHFRRLRRLCEKEGPDGIGKYVKRIKSIHAIYQQSNTMKAIGEIQKAIDQ